MSSQAPVFIIRLIFVSALALGALATGLNASAEQTGRSYRIGMLLFRPIPAWDAAFNEGLSRAGYVEGKNLEIRRMYSYSGDLQLGTAQARELIAFHPDVLVSEGTDRTRILGSLTTTTPIVFGASDPVGSGLAKDFARPGGNATGVSTQECSLIGKRVQFLKELAPTARRVALIISTPPSQDPCRDALKDATSSMKTVVAEEGKTAAAIRSLMLDPPEAVVIASAFGEREITMALGTKHVPVVSSSLKDGAVVALAPDITSIARRHAEVVARILGGAKPAEIPIELVSRFLVEVDLNRARQLGIRVPQSILLMADRVVQ